MGSVTEPRTSVETPGEEAVEFHSCFCAPGVSISFSAGGPRTTRVVYIWSPHPPVAWLGCPVSPREGLSPDPESWVEPCFFVASWSGWVAFPSCLSASSRQEKPFHGSAPGPALRSITAAAETQLPGSTAGLTNPGPVATSLHKSQDPTFFFRVP